MRTKDNTVETAFHSTITEFAFEVDSLYRDWDAELVITSGSESSAKHGKTSLHYATPGCAFDARSWSATTHGRGKVPSANEQQGAIQKAAGTFCAKKGIPSDWIEVILESDHLHIEYQPKRQF